MNFSSAKDIETSPSLKVGVGYSDNIRLRSSNEQSSAYTRVTPGIVFKKEGARVKTDFNYNVTGLFYASESDLNEVQHRLYANMESELVKHSIFLDLNATVSQELLRSNRYASSDGISGSQNLTETYTYKIAPYWKKKWQNFAESKLEYRYDEVLYSGSKGSEISRRAGDDSKANNIALSIESGKDFTRNFWTFDYDYKDISYDRRRDTRSEAYRIVLGHHYSRKLDFTFTTGYEDYNDGRNDGGTGWRAGLIWNPTPRTSLELETGRRFFGNTYLLDLKHRSRRLTWHFKYNDSIVSTRDQIINNNYYSQDNPDDTIAPLTNFTAQYYLSRRFTGDVSYSYRKSTISLGMFNVRRYFYDSDQKDEDDSGVNLSWNYKVGRRTDMTTFLSYQQLDDKNLLNISSLNNTQERAEFRWSLNRRLSPTMFGVLLISYRENSADRKTSEYKENAISLNITKRF